MSRNIAISPDPACDPDLATIHFSIQNFHLFYYLNDMESLLEQLLQRWEQAFDNLETLPGHKAQVKTTLYSDGSRYNLEKFDGKLFPSDGPLAKDKEGISPIGLHEYGFNAQGLPCYTTSRHDYNQITWEGFYTYSDTHAEYIDFCLNTGVPSDLKRMEFQEGRKVSFQSIVINGRGSGYSLSQMSKEEVISLIRNDGFSIIATVTRYEYGLTDKIEKSSSIHITPGIGKFTSYDEYTYDKNQTLDTIRTFFEQGTDRLTYCRVPENMSPESLVESLAEEMAGLIAETLADQHLTQPIALLELSYHYADNYIPLLVCQSAQEVAEKLANEEFTFIPDYYDDALQVETKPIEHLFARLEEMMEEKDDMKLGRKMLRKAAALLTRSKLFGKMKVTDDFAAYAIDWSIEGHSDAHFEEILLECGVEAGTIKIWKQKGILPE